MKLHPLAILLALGVIALSFGAPNVIAQSGGVYDLTWNTYDGGGATFSSGGVYSLGGTIGQADANTLNVGSYTLAGGFWNFIETITPPANTFKNFLPAILKNP